MDRSRTIGPSANMKNASNRNIAAATIHLVRSNLNAILFLHALPFRSWQEIYIGIRTNDKKYSGKPLLWRFVTEQFLTLVTQKPACHRNRMIAFLQDELTGNETRAPLVIVRAALTAVRGNVLL